MTYVYCNKYVNNGERSEYYAQSPEKPSEKSDSSTRKTFEQQGIPQSAEKLLEMGEARIEKASYTELPMIPRAWWSISIFLSRIATASVLVVNARFTTRNIC